MLLLVPEFLHSFQELFPSSGAGQRSANRSIDARRCQRRGALSCAGPRQSVGAGREPPRPTRLRMRAAREPPLRALTGTWRGSGAGLEPQPGVRWPASEAQWVHLRFHKVHQFPVMRLAAIHEVMGLATPQSRHLVTANCALQLGQAPRVWKVSKAWPHWLHFQ